MTDSLIELVVSLPGTIRRRHAAFRPLGPVTRLRGRVVVVAQGAVAVVTAPPELGGRVLEVLGSGLAFSGGRSADDRSGGTYELVALKPTTLLEMPPDSVARQVERNPRVCVAIAEANEERSRRFLERSAVCATSDPLRRVAGALLYLLDPLGERCPAGNRAYLKLPQVWLAAVADLSRQTVNRQLALLRTARVVHLARRFCCITDAARLAALAAGTGPSLPLAAGEHRCCREQQAPNGSTGTPQLEGAA